MATREVAIILNGKIGASLKGATNETLKRLDRINQKTRQMTQQARSQLIDGVGMAAALAIPIKKAVEFESAMADVRKVVDGLDDKRQFARMSKDILTLSNRIPMTAEGLAQIVAAGGQAGIARKELSGFAESAAKMGIAFDITADEAGQLMANWRTSFRMGQKDVIALADKINYLGNTTAASAPKISEVVTRIGPLGEVGGLASGEIAALAASMVAMGTGPEMAATGIKKVITVLNAGSAATKKQREAFQAMGIDAQQLARRMQEDAGGAIVSVMQKLKGLPKYQQTAVLKELFGEEALAAVGALLPALDQVETNMRKVSKASNYAGSMEQEFQARSQTTANSLQLLQNKVTSAAIKVGSVLLPELVKIVNIVSPVIDRVVKWADANPELTSTIVKVVAALVAMRIAVLAGRYAMLVIKGGIGETAQGMLKLIKNIKKATIASKAQTVALKAKAIGLKLVNAATKAYAIAARVAKAAQWALNAAWTANPVGVIIVAVAALIGIIYLLVKNWDKVKAGAIAAWEWMKKHQTLVTIMNPVLGLIVLIAKNWDKVKAGIIAAWGWIKTFTTKGPGRFIPIVAAIRTVVENWDKVKAAVLAVWNALKRVWDFHKKIGGKVWSTVTSVVGKAPAKHAKGGIVTRPTLSWIGEQGPEAVVPLRDRARGLSMLDRTANLLGVGGGGSGITVNFNPTINAPGGDPDRIASAMVDAKEDLRRMLRDLLRDERRTAMA